MPSGSTIPRGSSSRRPSPTRRCARRFATLGRRGRVPALTPRPSAGRGRLVRGLRADDRRRGARVARTRRGTRRSLACGFRAVRPLTGEVGDYDELARTRRRRSHYVLLGEASHGTHEFYRERAEITKRLIAEAGFTAVAVEADWPDAYRVNRYVRGAGDDADADEALGDFERFPAWMWRNVEVAEFVTLLREWNDALAGGRPQGRVLRPRPVQPLHVDGGGVELPGADRPGRPPRGPRAALRLLRPVRPRSAGLRVRGRARGRRSRASSEAVQQLLELQRLAAEAARRDGHVDADRHFYAEQNARLVVERRGVLPGDVPRRRRELEPARPAHGRDARRARGAPGARRRAGEGRGVGAQLPPRRRTRDRARADRRAEPRPARARAGTRPATRCSSASPPTTARSPRHRTGAAPPSASASAARSRAAGRSCSTSATGPRSCSIPVRAAAAGAWSARSASSTGPRPSGMSHYFHARLADQFDAVVHIDATTAWSRWSAPASGRPASCPRRIHGASDHADGGQGAPTGIPPRPETGRRPQVRARRPRRLERAPALRGKENAFIDAHGYAGTGAGTSRSTRAPAGHEGPLQVPVGDFSAVHRCAILAAESRAGQRKYADVQLAAAHVHGMLEGLRTSSGR